MPIVLTQWLSASFLHVLGDSRVEHRSAYVDGKQYGEY